MVMTTPAFALGAATSTFTPTRVRSSTTPLRTTRPRCPPSHATVTMQKKKGFFSNPFSKPKKAPSGEQFVQPQAGDPGYQAPGPVAKGTGMAKSEPKKLPVKDASEKDAGKGGKKGEDKRSFAKRGIDLLREDLFKSAPERAGVGRQDARAIMKPMAGEPGFKPAAYETVKVSELGISPFPDDKNAVGKVGGVEAVKKAALQVKAGKKAAEIKNEVLNIKTKVEKEVFDIPDYLKPIPEDYPKSTWKNYKGR